MTLKLITAPATEPITATEAKAQCKVEHSVDDALFTILIKGAREAAEHLTGRAFITQTWEQVLHAFPRAAIELPKPRVTAVTSVKYLEVVATTAITATTISAQASDNSFNDSGAGFVAAGFTVGKSVRVQGFTGDVANNVYAGVLTAVAAGKLTIGGTDGDVIVDDAAGESVTITQWETLDSSLYLLDADAVPPCIVPAPDTDWPDTLDTINAVRVRFTAGYGDATAVPASIKQWMLLQIAAAYRNREAFATGISIAELPNRFVDGMLDSERTYL